MGGGFDGRIGRMNGFSETNCLCVWPESMITFLSGLWQIFRAGGGKCRRFQLSIQSEKIASHTITVMKYHDNRKQRCDRSKQTNETQVKRRRYKQTTKRLRYITFVQDKTPRNIIPTNGQKTCTPHPTRKYGNTLRTTRKRE